MYTVIKEDNEFDYEPELVEALAQKGFKVEDIDDLIDSERLTLVARGEWELDGEPLLNIAIVGNC